MSKEKYIFEKYIYKHHNYIIEIQQHLERTTTHGFMTAEGWTDFGHYQVVVCDAIDSDIIFYKKILQYHHSPFYKKSSNRDTQHDIALTKAMKFIDNSDGFDKFEYRHPWLVKLFHIQPKIRITRKCCKHYQEHCERIELEKILPLPYIIK